jgi:serine/threonine protein kinase
MLERRELNDGSGRTALVDGTVVGGYRVKYLACGGMSCVYRSELDGRSVVLKEVAAANTREVPSLISEKNLLERLDHPGVVGFQSFFNQAGHYYLVLDYVDGKPLSVYLTPDHQAEPKEVADWGIQLCEIFEYLHAQKPPVIYRDLKAENVMLKDGEIRLIDFGIARLHKGVRAQDTELMGSPATASPEHYGGAETDARSDIYTLGASLYELMTGGRRKQVGAFQFAPVRELNPKVTPQLEAVLTKATAFKPDDRYQSAVEMRNALLKATGKKVPKATPKSASEQSPQKSGVPIALLVVLALICGFGWYGYSYYQETKSPFYGGPVESIGTYETSLPVDIFKPGEVDGKSAVMLGEDIGLFEVTPAGEYTAPQRSQKLSNRLNSMYHQACIACGGTGLEPVDIKMGRHLESGQTVVFYAHMHGPHIHWGPELLATVTPQQAEALGVTPRFVAGYWRDLIRDTVNLSRGFNVKDSVMGAELSDALLKARDKIKQDNEQLTNLRAVLEELTGRESLKLRELFLTVPDISPKPDSFENVEGYEPLNL